MRGVLNATITAAAKETLNSFLARPRDFPPTLVFLKGREATEQSDYWMYNAYAPHNLSGLRPGLWLLGRPLLYDCDGFVVAIPQYKFVSELEGKLLSVSGANRLVVLERKHDG
jgi:hypothetical protein